VVRKGYGRIFVCSLPEVPLVKGPASEVLEELARFLADAAPVED